jgi:hypothetical protein
MRLPSVEYLLGETRSVLRRFPLPMGAALLGTGILLRAIETGGGMDPLAPVALGIPLFLALRLAGERRLVSRPVEIVLTLLVVAGLVALHLGWPGWGDRLRFIRYAQLFVAAHLLVAVVPFLRREEGFRPFNRHLLLRTLEGGLQAAVIFAGLSAALFAVNQLFPVEISSRAYQRLAVVLGFLYLPLFVLSGLRLDAPTQDPRPLRVVGQYILVPLAALYLAILTAYLGQVVVTRSWPGGWIGWLVSWMAVAGTLSVLLVRPDRREERAWAWVWERAYWILMLPAAAMMLVAVGMRVNQYGVTEARYMALVLGGWLAVMAATFGLTRVRDLRLLPASLAAVLLLTVAGPWGVATVSRESQLDRLRALLEANAMLANGEAVPAPLPVPQQDVREIHAAFLYLFDTHRGFDMETLIGGLEAVGDTAGAAADAFDLPESGRRDAYRRAETVVQALGLDPWAVGLPDPRGIVVVGLSAEVGIGVDGVARVVLADEGAGVRVGERRYVVGLDREAARVTLVESGGARLSFDLSPLLEAGLDVPPTPNRPSRAPRLELDARELTLEADPVDPAADSMTAADRTRVRLVVREVGFIPSGEREAGPPGPVVVHLQAAWLIVD